MCDTDEVTFYPFGVPVSIMNEAERGSAPARTRASCSAPNEDAVRQTWYWLKQAGFELDEDGVTNQDYGPDVWYFTAYKH